MNLFNLFKRRKKSEESQQQTENEIQLEEIVNQEIDQVDESLIEQIVEEITDSNTFVEPTSETFSEEIIAETPSITEEEITDTNESTEVIKRSKYEPVNRLEPYSSDLTEFLGYFWSNDGQRDGYYLHSSDFLKKRKISLISEFQRLVEKRVDELKLEKLNCKLMIIDLKDSSPSIVEKLILRIELCDDYIHDLHNEKVVSNAGNGLIRGVLTQYEVGYDQGMSDYLSDTVFLNPLKRL
jgi:hypothetical protein